MKIVKQISSLEKVRLNDNLDYDEICKTSVLRGERYSYQIAVRCRTHIQTEFELKGLEITSSLLPYIKVYSVLNAVMDAPTVYPIAFEDVDYITHEPGLMPDILEPISAKNNMWMVHRGSTSIWVEVNIPVDCKPGEYPIQIRLSHKDTGEEIFCKTMTVEVIDKDVLPQSLIYTRWLYTDCIADYHHVDVYSEEHWALIEEYIKAAVDMGINMILVPVHTPPLDTAIGSTRKCVQLVDIKYENGKYTFGFDKFRRFIDTCKKSGVKYYEIAHLFSQWGAKCAPNIMVEENGKKNYKFGWHVAADSSEYTEFLTQYIAAIAEELKMQGISENTYFHVSDEPHADVMENYKRATETIAPLIGEAKTFDALSDVDFYKQGIVKCPVTCVDHISTFLKENPENIWAYYCCGPQFNYTNSFMAMPSRRVRILGVLLYKFNIQGFLHWGLNYYNAPLSRYAINPYVTTSCDGTYPSGDPFILYPVEGGCIPSLRGKVTYDAIGDMNLCRTLEQYIGRESVIKLIDETAGFDVTFDEYPRNKDYIFNLREKMIDIIKNL